MKINELQEMIRQKVNKRGNAGKVIEYYNKGYYKSSDELSDIKFLIDYIYELEFMLLEKELKERGVK